MASKAPPSSVAAALEEFARHPARVGSPFPATPAMIRRVLDPLDWSAIRLLVEYGPGTGRFTFEALRRLRPDARLIAIESGERFAENLRYRNDDPRLTVVHGVAQDVRHHLLACGYTSADCVVTGLPFSTLHPSVAARIAADTAAILSPNGTLAAYQMRRTIEPLLERHFARVEHSYEWWNIPPCHIYWAKGVS